MKITDVIDESLFAEPELQGVEDSARAMKEANRGLADIKPYLKRFASLKRKREPMEPIWRELQRYLAPDCGRFLNGDSPNAGDERYDIDMSSILDSSPSKAAMTAASGIHGGLTSPSVQWFSFYVGDYSDFKDRVSGDAKEWVYNSQLAVRDALANGNFYATIQRYDLEILCFGTAVMLAYTDYETIARFYHCTVGTYWLDQDDTFRIDTMYRKYASTARNIMNRYGKDNCPRAVVEAMEKGDADKPFYIIQCIQPWNFFGNGRPHPEYRFEDVRFVEGSSEHDPILFKGGYITKPFVAARWADTGDAIYGRTCPGMQSLPDNKQLQLATEHANVAVEWKTDPAWVVPSEFKEKAEKDGIAPGMVFPGSGDAKNNAIMPVAMPEVDLNVNMQQRMDLRQIIQDAFFNRLFLMIQGRQRQMTATEVMQLIQEKSDLLGPIIEQMMSETLTPVLNRVFDIIAKSLAALPEPPTEIAGQEIRPYFTSALAIAQRQASLSGSTTMAMWVMQMMNAFPELAQSIDIDQWLRWQAEADNLPANVIVPRETVEEMRAAQAQAMQQQQQMAGAAQTIDMAKQLGDTKMSPDTALGQMSGAQAEYAVA